MGFDLGGGKGAIQSVSHGRVSFSISEALIWSRPSCRTRCSISGSDLRRSSVRLSRNWMPSSARVRMIVRLIRSFQTVCRCCVTCSSISLMIRRSISRKSNSSKSLRKSRVMGGIAAVGPTASGASVVVVFSSVSGEAASSCQCGAACAYSPEAAAAPLRAAAASSQRMEKAAGLSGVATGPEPCGGGWSGAASAAGRFTASGASSSACRQSWGGNPGRTRLVSNSGASSSTSICSSRTGSLRVVMLAMACLQSGFQGMHLHGESCVL
ncbi:hypothetical protein AFE_2202 [Acidithiobacillus ferrooxidans ATCC 23270]|uniref:Uncharacterized protein n=1 Tax=Acidithiobacillus ferrooxidans (strain ATCC 23270 / DSM 14882 / CIP 104768 / NCIMB 8455) TaxID=243159 RepID=B7J5J1_ACIF2|nr:hypothetical protein AFE_2202 [Acidithiobacillus ferrooxidans ATCC 23270]